MRYPYPLFFACSTCSGVPPLYKLLIFNDFIKNQGGTAIAFRRVPTCSRCSASSPSRQHPEQAANPRRPWPVDEPGNRMSAPAADALPDARAHRNARCRRPDLPRFGTTTHRPSPAGQWSPWRSVPPAPAGRPARPVGARHGLMQPRHQPPAPWVNRSGPHQRLTTQQRTASRPAGDHRPGTSTCRSWNVASRYDRQKADARGGKAPALPCRPGIRQQPSATSNASAAAWARGLGCQALGSQIIIRRYPCHT